MMLETKRFIAPGGWFAMQYPNTWSEFEDSTESFLFYNPDVWDGNFRISAYQENGNRQFGLESLRQCLVQNSSASRITIGSFQAAYSEELFEEDETEFITYNWEIAAGSLLIEVSFTTLSSADKAIAEKIITSLEPRDLDKKYPAEVVTVRIAEISEINEAFDWTLQLVKAQLNTDFQGLEEELDKLQQVITSADLSAKKRASWIALGISLCVIMMNEIDGLEWCSLIDGNREAPVLRKKDSEDFIDPMKLVWSRKKRGEEINVKEIYQEAVEELFH